jgi:hypothetical protein
LSDCECEKDRKREWVRVRETKRACVRVCIRETERGNRERARVRERLCAYVWCVFVCVC